MTRSYRSLCGSPTYITCSNKHQSQRELSAKERYHGAISRENADFLLTIGGEGSYLIRESLRAPGQFTLAIRFEGITKNFKLYYDGQHYVGEKRFDTVQDLVADGLITFYLESKAADYIAALSSQSNYAESPYVAYNTHKKCCLVPRSKSGGSTGVTRSRNPSSGSGGSLGNRASLPVEGRVSKFSDSRHNVTIVSAPATIITPALSQTVLEQPAEGSTVIPDGCRRKSSTSSVPELPPGDRATAVTAPAPQLPPRVLDYKKPHSFKMLEEPDLFPPCQPVDSSTSSPSLNMHVVVSAASEHDKAVPHNFKASSVTWCTDYLQVMGCEKPHNFKQHTFRGPHWCDFCANFLWGLIAQGVKCQDCGFNAHKKCSEKVPNDCMPDMKYVKRMFGVDLTTLVKAQNTLIPIVVNMCIQEIEARVRVLSTSVEYGVEYEVEYELSTVLSTSVEYNCLDSEGLYRVAGFHDDVEAIRMSFDKDGELTDISTDRYDDINTIASVLKLYLRLLPIPLITFDLYHKVIDVITHFHTLKYLIAHLYRVTEQKQVNMMSPENLATVFAPTILRSPETDPLTSLTAVKYERELVDLIIIHQNILFDSP
ncbi:hypothetical protein NP493_406g00006 [Ridgeia piscesae]|uniref:N-chimaerin n=1 Tax=Ridgeia piscesae TaxID=27915 RepID=A0AAD9NSW5_RIDPI|nr:hypothetical protein NP493_406g00006 [Ridgeia piscesae]